MELPGRVSGLARRVEHVFVGAVRLKLRPSERQVQIGVELRGRWPRGFDTQRRADVGVHDLSGVIDNISAVDSVLNVLGLDINDYIGFVVGFDDSGDIDWFITLFHRGSEPIHVSMYKYLEVEKLTLKPRACWREEHYQNAF